MHISSMIKTNFKKILSLLISSCVLLGSNNFTSKKVFALELVDASFEIALDDSYEMPITETETSNQEEDFDLKENIATTEEIKNIITENSQPDFGSTAVWSNFQQPTFTLPEYTSPKQGLSVKALWLSTDHEPAYPDVQRRHPYWVNKIQDHLTLYKDTEAELKFIVFYTKNNSDYNDWHFKLTKLTPYNLSMQQGYWHNGWSAAGTHDYGKLILNQESQPLQPEYIGKGPRGLAKQQGQKYTGSDIFSYKIDLDEVGAVNYIVKIYDSTDRLIGYTFPLYVNTISIDPIPAHFDYIQKSLDEINEKLNKKPGWDWNKPGHDGDHNRPGHNDDHNRPGHDDEEEEEDDDSWYDDHQRPDHDRPDHDDDDDYKPGHDGDHDRPDYDDEYDYDDDYRPDHDGGYHNSGKCYGRHGEKIQINFIS